MIRVITTTVYTCDLCDQECQPVTCFTIRNPAIFPDRSHDIDLYPQVSTYNTRRGHVCRECLLPALSDYVRRMSGDGEKGGGDDGR